MKVVEGFANGLAPFMEQVNSLIQSGLDEIGSFFSNFLSAGGEIINNIVSGVRGGLDSVRQIFDDVLNAMTHPLETAQGIIENIMSTIEGIFHGLDLSLPDIALPHFWVNGGEFPYGIGGMGYPPDFGVDWYGTGGFANEPTLNGYGERGLELYWPGYSPYFEKYAQGIAEHMPKGAGGVDIHDCTFNVRKDSDIRAVAIELNTLINRQTAGGIA